MEQKERLVRGMKFPPQADPVTGRFRTSEGGQNVKEALYLILMTQKTERKVNPEFGSEVLSYTFSDTSPTMLHLMEHRLRTVLLTQEPRIAELMLHIEKKDNEEKLYINLEYTVKETRERTELTLPFPWNGGEGL